MRVPENVKKEKKTKRRLNDYIKYLKASCAGEERSLFSLFLTQISGAEMATHSSILVWEVPWKEKTGRLYSIWSQESDTT